MPFAARKSAREAGGRPAAGIQAVDGARLGFVINDEEVAAEPVAGRLHQSDRRVGGNRRIDGVAAALEDLHPARAASGWLAATMPKVVDTTDRPTIGARGRVSFADCWALVAEKPLARTSASVRRIATRRTFIVGPSRRGDSSRSRSRIAQSEILLRLLCPERLRRSRARTAAATTACRCRGTRPGTASGMAPCRRCR